MDLAEKTPCVVFESPPKPAHSIDALLLFADHAITHSSLRKTLAVLPLDEGQKTARSRQWTPYWQNDSLQLEMLEKDRVAYVAFAMRHSMSPNIS